MNIALFSDTYKPEINGVATSVSILCNELRENGHNVYIVTTNPYSSSVEFKDNILRIPGIELKRIYGYRLAGVYSFHAVKIIKGWHLDLIHSNTEYGIGIFAKILAPRLKLPLVYTYHTMIEDYAYYVTRGIFDYTIRKMAGGLSRFYGDTCTELISPSNKTKIALRRYGVSNYINVVPTGINIDRFSPSNFTKEQLLKMRKSLGLKETDYVLLSLGRVANEKNIDTLIYSFNYLLKHNDENIPYKLLIVGGGPAVASLQSLAATLPAKDDIIFVGRVEQVDVPLYYNLGNVFCSASLSETQGLTFIEAMAASLLIIAKYDQNLDETLVEGKTGYYFEDETDFHEKVKQLYALPLSRKQTMSEFCLEKAKGFSSHIFYQKIMEVYQRAIKKKW